MKKLFLLIIVHSALYISNCYSQQYGWVALTSPNANTVFRRIILIENEAWMLGNDNIFHSNNFPIEQFSSQYLGTTTFNDLIVKNYNGVFLGWAVGYASEGARTIDGINWTLMYLSGNSTFTGVSFPTSSLGFASGSDGRLHKTTNGGIDWFDAGVHLSNGSINTIVFIDTLNGYIGGGAPSFKKTIDGGFNWSNIGGYTGTINDIYFLDETHGWAVGANDILIFDGNNWLRIANPSSNNLSSVFFIDLSEGWIVGMNGEILHSTDGGINWTAQTSGTTATLRDVFFTSLTNGYAVGNNGTILHYTQITDVEEQPTQLTEFKLEQNYPNPFNPSTVISYQLPISSKVTLQVYDILGREVATLIDEEKSAGSYEIDFNASHLASGIYYYQLRAGDFVQTRKMILVK